MINFLNILGLSMITYSTIKYINYDKNNIKDVLYNIYMENNIYTKHKKVKLTPTIVDSKDYDWGKQLIILIPEGLNPNKFTDNEEIFESALDKKIIIERKRKRIYLSIINKKLKQYDYNKKITKLLKSYHLAGYIGKTLKRDNIILDFTKSTNAHLLVAGYTGTGKSTFIRQLIYGMSKAYNSNHVQFYFSDLKDGGKEAKICYNLSNVTEISTNIEYTNKLIDDMVNEMKERGNLTAKYNKDTFNQLKKEGKTNKPYIIFIIDEFHRLRNQETLNKIELLLSQARSAGIHLILGTQRPSADIIPGTIKANLSSFLSFRTNNELNSRIILDNNKAAHLPTIPRRAIFQTDKCYELQVPLVSNKLFPNNKKMKIINNNIDNNKNEINKEFGRDI